MRTKETIYILVVTISFLLCVDQSSAQMKQIPLFDLVEKAEQFLKENQLSYQDYYLIEISEDNKRVATKNERWYQIWAKNDSIAPMYAGTAISSTGKIVELQPPFTLLRFAKKESKPKLSLKNALMLAKEFASKNKLVKRANYLDTAYLITYQDSVQYWNVLGDSVSLYVLMDGTVQIAPEL